MKSLLCITFLTASAFASEPAVDWAKRAQEASWIWPDEPPSLLQSTISIGYPYQAVLEQIWTKKSASIWRKEFLVHIRCDDEERLKFVAHAATVFAQSERKFVYAQFNPISSGCVVVAYDLEAKKQLWETRLQGIGPVDHSFYTNRVSIEIVAATVQVRGWEDGGKYLEYLDLETGKSLGHRLFKSDAPTSKTRR